MPTQIIAPSIIKGQKLAKAGKGVKKEECMSSRQQYKLVIFKERIVEFPRKSADRSTV